MEPLPNTPAALQPVLDELAAREPLFHRPEYGTTRADFDAMMAPVFWEIGASGQRYSREFVLDTLERRGTDAVQNAVIGEAVIFIAANCRRILIYLPICLSKGCALPDARRCGV